MEARARTVATLRCLGAGSGLILRVFLIQVGVLCGAGVVIGVAIGALLPVVGLWLFGDLLPVPASVRDLSRPARLGRPVWRADRRRFRALAARPARHRYPARRCSGTRCCRPAGACRRRHLGRQHRASGGAGRHRGGHRAGPDLFALSFCGSAAATLAGVPRRRLAADAGGPARPGAAPGGVAARRGQPVPPRQPGAAAAGGARPRPHNAWRRWR